MGQLPLVGGGSWRCSGGILGTGLERAAPLLRRVMLKAARRWAIAWEAPNRTAETSSLSFKTGRYRNSHRAGRKKIAPGCLAFMAMLCLAHSLHIDQKWKRLNPKKTK